MNDAELLRGALVGLEDTAAASGTQTAPTTATDIISAPIPTLNAGKYEIDVTINLSGSAEAQVRNLNMRLGTTVLFANLPSVSGTVTLRLYRSITNADIVAGGGLMGGSLPLNFRTAANGTAGAIYTVAVRATKRGG